MAKVWLCRLSDVKDAARELFALVGADNDDLRGGTTGRRTPLESVFCKKTGTVSDMVCFLLCGGPEELALLPGSVVARRLEEALDGFLTELDDLRDERRSGMTTTGTTSNF